MTSSWKAPRVPEPFLPGDDGDLAVRPPEELPVPQVAREDLLDLGELDPPDGVGRMDDDGQPVPGDDDLEEVLLVALELPRGHADLAGAALAGLDAGARAAALDVDPESGALFHEDLGPLVGERLDARRAGQGQVGLRPADAAGRKKGDPQDQEDAGEAGARHVISGIQASGGNYTLKKRGVKLHFILPLFLVHLPISGVS